MRISLIMPFRERIEMFDKLMRTLFETTKEPEEIEIVIVIDNDDEVVQKEKDNLINKYKPFNLVFYSVGRSEHFVRDYFNYAANKATGRFIMGISDDAEFKTKNWDRIVYERMDGACDGIGYDLAYGLIKDGIDRHGENPNFPHFTCWPVIGRVQLEILGFMFFPWCYMWGADHYIAMMYKQLPSRHTVSLTEVFIDQDSIHTSRRAHDKFFNRFQEIQKRTDIPGELKEKYIKESADKLNEYINGH